MTRRFQFSVERMCLALPMLLAAAAFSSALPMGKRHPALGLGVLAAIVVLVVGSGAVIL